MSDYERGKSTIYGCWVSVKLIEIQQKDDLFPSGIISPLTGPLGAALVLSWLGTMQKSEQVMRSGERREGGGENWGALWGPCASSSRESSQNAKRK